MNTVREIFAPTLLRSEGLLFNRIVVFPVSRKYRFPFPGRLSGIAGPVVSASSTPAPVDRSSFSNVPTV